MCSPGGEAHLCPRAPRSSHLLPPPPGGASRGAGEEPGGGTQAAGHRELSRSNPLLCRWGDERRMSQLRWPRCYWSPDSQPPAVSTAPCGKCQGMWVVAMFLEPPLATAQVAGEGLPPEITHPSVRRPLLRAMLVTPHSKTLRRALGGCRRAGSGWGRQGHTQLFLGFNTFT